MPLAGLDYCAGFNSVKIMLPSGALKYIITTLYLTTWVQLSYMESFLKTKYQAIGTYPKTNILAT